ncbi:MAG TPA: zinc ribbon domain-containing protein [Planctomycetota bacterium]|nr:zinc ribbon domain-containing protein [Planctomycetota bacterium]
MPTYDYVCQACGHRLEIFQPMSEAPKKKCPKCSKSKLQRQIGMGAAVLFKGSGFYQTDYRSSSYTEGAKKEAPKPDSAKAEPAKAAESKKSEPATPAPTPAAPATGTASKSARKKPS